MPDFAALFIGMPKELAVLLMAMIPIAELRVALPVALTAYDLPLWSAFLFSVVGNMIPVVLVVWFLEPFSKWIRRHSTLADHAFGWLFKRTRKRLEKLVHKYGPLALMLFVAVPLPVTGGWTGSAAAFIFGIPRKQAIFWIFCGIIIAGIIVSFLTLGGAAVVDLLRTS